MRLLTLSTLLCAVLALTRAAAERSRSCSRGWSEFKGRCLIYIPKRMTWAQAGKNCQKLDGNLASVRDVVQHKGLQSLLMTSSLEYKRAWIGGSDAQEENQWFWSDGTPFKYTNWCHKEPNNYRDEDCLEMYTKGENCWNDQRCSDQIPSVCAKKLNFDPRA